MEHVYGLDQLREREHFSEQLDGQAIRHQCRELCLQID